MNKLGNIQEGEHGTSPSRNGKFTISNLKSSLLRRYSRLWNATKITELRL